MLVELTEDDYVDMGIGRALVRTMLRKAKEIVASLPAPAAVPADPEMLLVAMEQASLLGADN